MRAWCLERSCFKVNDENSTSMKEFIESNGLRPEGELISIIMKRDKFHLAMKMVSLMMIQNHNENASERHINMINSSFD